MAKGQIMFYATALDLIPVLSALEAAEPLQYTLAGTFKSKKPQIYLTHGEIPDIGRAIHPTAVANPCYLLSPRGTHIHMREIPQKSGEIFFGVDQLENPDSVSLRPGGRYGDAVILYGAIGAVTQTAISKRIFTLAAKAFRKTFVRQKEFLLGPEAREVWDKGVRLTVAASSPVEFDLKRDSTTAT